MGRHQGAGGLAIRLLGDPESPASPNTLSEGAQGSQTLMPKGMDSMSQQQGPFLTTERSSHLSQIGRVSWI